VEDESFKQLIALLLRTKLANHQEKVHTKLQKNKHTKLTLVKFVSQFGFYRAAWNAVAV